MGKMGYCRELLYFNIDAFTQAQTVIEGVDKMVCTYKPTGDSSLLKNKSKVQKVPSCEALFLGKSGLQIVMLMYHQSSIYWYHLWPE